MATTEWHYSTGDDHQMGPVSAKELSRLAASGDLRPDDLVWKEGMDEWVPASRVKALQFPATVTESPATPPSPTKFDAESLQATLHDVQRKADEAAGVLWFLDLKFSRFVSATIIRIVWTLYLAVVALALVVGTVGAILKYPILEAIVGTIGSLIAFSFLTLLLRVSLEAFMVIFRMAEHLRDLNEKTTSRLVEN